jgi:hypothetical protein
MPTYHIRDPQSGKQIELKGDGPPPTAQELTEIFAKLNAPAQEPSAGPVQRFAEGMGRNLNPMNMVSLLGQVVTDPKAAGAAVIDPSVAQLEQVAPAAREGRPLAALGHVAASVPIVGPTVAAAIEKMRSGDVAGGAGELTGAAAPFAAGPLVRGAGRAVRAVPAIAEPLAAMAERGSTARLTDVMAPKVGPNKARMGNVAADIAPQIAREPGLNAFSREGLQGGVAAKLDEATAGLDAAADARLASQQVKTAPLLKAIDDRIAELTASPVEASKFPRERVAPPNPTKAEQVRGITGELTPGQVAKTEPFGQAVEPAPNASQIATLKQIRGEIQQLGPVAPYEAIRRIRQSWDAVAKVKYLPSTQADALKAQGDATGAVKGTGAMRDALAGTDEGSAAANARYSLFKSANDVLEATAEAERVRPKVGRGIMARATGAMVGAHEGGVIGAGIGATVAAIADKMIDAAPTMQIAIARRLAAVADALRQGDTAGAQQLVDRTVARFPAIKGGLKVSGQLLGSAGRLASEGLPLAADQDPGRRP